MLKNYFFSILRNFRKNKLYSFINISGLALGLAVALLISLYVQNELSYDRWIDNHENVYRVYRSWQSGSNTVWTPDPLTEALEEQFPEVINAAALTPYGEVLMSHKDKKLYLNDVAQVDSNFFEVINFPLQSGDRRDILDNPNSLVLSLKTAETIFGAADAVGQVVRFNDQYDLIVTGILELPQGHSHLQYNAYVRYDWSSPSWTGNNRASYVLLNEFSNVSQTEAKITQLIKPLWEKEIRDNGGDPTAQEFPRWGLQPLQEIHINSAQYGWFDSSGGDMKYIYIFLMIAAIVLFIATINYINLSTARAVERAKEVGVRKVAGASRLQIAVQFLGEAFLQTVIAFAFSIVIASLFMPCFNGIVDRDLTLLQADWPVLMLIMLALVVVMSLLSGSYPAFMVSGYKPAISLKGKLRHGRGGQSFRRALVVIQFSMSVVLVIVMLFIYRQVQFMMNNDLGFQTEQVISIPLNNPRSFKKVEKLKTEFKQIPGVQEVSTASRNPGTSLPDWTIKIEGKFENHSPHVLFCDDEYAQTLGIPISSGRFFSKDFPTDTMQAFVVNEAFVRDYGIDNPIGQKLKFSSDENYSTIVGVLKDYHYQGLDVPIQPILLAMSRNRWYATLRLSTNNISKTISSIENVWPEVEPNHPMRVQFLDQEFGKQYEEYQRFGNALMAATVLTLLVAILGLFGLVTYTTLARTKEIGIRKVMGATITEISLMLIRDFVRWVLLAGVISIPIAWYLVQKWLIDFAHRTIISPVPFVIAIATTIILAAVTVQIRTFKAARKNPVEALRHE